MTNNEVSKYIETIKNNKNLLRNYLSEICVTEGYGQSCGGYLKKKSKLTQSSQEPLSQAEHFLNYYKNKQNISYSYLRCPQLLLFIAEFSGLSNKRLISAYDILKKYEDEKNLKGTEKNGNYIYRKQAFKDFKTELCISDLVKIIKTSKDWNDVISKTKNL